MIRRLFLLTLLLATVAAFALYCWQWAGRGDVPDQDPVRQLIDPVRKQAPEAVSVEIDAGISRLEVWIRDLRWLFVASFALLYIQFFIRKRPKPANEKQAELLKRKRSKAFGTQVKVLFFAVLLISGMVLGIELLARAPTNEIEVLSYKIERGDAGEFKRNVYHYGLILAVVHLAGYILFTWFLLSLGARKQRKNAARAAAAASAAAK